MLGIVIVLIVLYVIGAFLSMLLEDPIEYEERKRVERREKNIAKNIKALADRKKFK